MGDTRAMQTIYEVADPVTTDSLSIERDGDRLLVRSVADERERVTILCRGRAEGLRLAAALFDALESEAA